MVASHRRKLARAEFHIENVETLIAEWSRDGYRTFEEPKSAGRFIGFAEIKEPLSHDLALVIGDALQCLRSSLDHIIFGLSQKNPSFTTDKEHIPQFPIRDTAVELGSYRIQFLSKAAQKTVRDMAPDPTRQPLDQDALWLLDKANNRDKHRTVAITPLIEAGFGSYALLASDGTDFFHDLPAQALEMEAPPVPLYEIARNPNVKAKVTPSAHVVFDKSLGVGEREVGPTLWWFHDHIRDTVFQALE